MYRKERNPIGGFTIIKTQVIIEGKTHDTYGIKKDIICIEDISTNRNAVQSFVDKLNRNEVSDCHLLELIEDEFFC